MINDSINRFLGVLCYPFTSRQVFQKDYMRDYIMERNSREKNQDILKTIRDNLRMELIEYIRRDYNIYSYDEIYLYLEKCYLYPAENHPNEFEMYSWVMQTMASTLISHRDGKIVFKYWKNEHDEDIFGGFAGENKVKLFHSLNCHMPLDVIVIMYMIINQNLSDIECLDNFYGNIEVADQQLSRVLEQGVAENHLHKGVSRTFPSIWNSLMEPLTIRKGKELLKSKLINGTKEENKKMLFYILGCGIVRGWLVFRFLQEKFGENDMGGEVPESIRKLTNSFGYGQDFENFYRDEFQDREGAGIIAFYEELWEDLWSLMPKAVFCGDFCRNALNEDAGLHTFDENIFLYHALKHFIDKKAPVEIRQCIIQYLRIRGNVFHISVQQKTIKGLDYFQQAHYSINSSMNHITTKNFWDDAIREQLQNSNLHKVEFRTSMPQSYVCFKKEVTNFLNAYKKILLEEFYDLEHGRAYRRIPQVGLVVHFLKRPDGRSPEKCIKSAEGNCSYLQFGRLQKEYERQMDAFLQLRMEHSEMSRYLVGIDAASLENSTPVWVFVPVYKKARGSEVERIGGSGRRGEYVQSLGFTFHAGEDFRHILSGLRRIDETVEYLKFHAGDRIGHGIALGINARAWKRQNPVVIIPQIEALENYLWAYDMLSRNYSDFQASVLAYMEQRIFYLAKKIYNVQDISMEALIEGYHALFQGAAVAEIFEEKYRYVEENLCKKMWVSAGIRWSADLLAAARHCRMYLKKMEEPIHYEITEQDLLIIEELQKMLKEKLGRRGIVIEINPSSNMAISDLEKLEENQLYQMNRPNDQRNVLVCVNSDDPAVFNTNVSNELAYIYYGMLEQNVSRETALVWIDRIRKSGMDSSFIHHHEPDNILFEKLLEMIEEM